MRPSRNHSHSPIKEPVGLLDITSLLAFLIGVLIFLLFGESLWDLKPDPLWIALLMGLVVSTVVFWAWGEIHTKGKNNDK